MILSSAVADIKKSLESSNTNVELGSKSLKIKTKKKFRINLVAIAGGKFIKSLDDNLVGGNQYLDIFINSNNIEDCYIKTDEVIETLSYLRSQNFSQIKVNSVVDVNLDCSHAVRKITIEIKLNKK